MFGIIVVLVLAIVVLAVWLGIMRREIRYMGRQLEDLSAGRSEKKISLTLVDSRLSELAAQINDNIELQKQLRIDMRKNEQQLRDSIANISHDLRTPLTAIIGYIQLLERSGLNENQQEKAAVILKKANAMRSLVESFFELSVMESGKTRLAEETVNVTNILAETVVDFIPRFEAAQIQPKIEIPDKSLFITGDATALSRITQNLLSNALKYTKDAVRVSLAEHRGSVALTVENNVDAAAELVPEKLFDRFYTADDARNNGSTGLGLYIVRLLSEKMQGRAEAEIRGENLVIRVTFPKR